MLINLEMAKAKPYLNHLNQLEETDAKLKVAGNAANLSKNDIKEEIKRRLTLYPTRSYFEIANDLHEDILASRWPAKWIK